MLRSTWSGDSSNETNSTRSPRAHAASTMCPARLVLPVPLPPLTSTVEPRYTPPSSM